MINRSFDDNYEKTNDFELIIYYIDFLELHWIYR